MSIIEEVRREREDLARVLKKHTGIRKIVEDLYPDSAHFIYELLQNAEDTGATEACFVLSKSGLVFEHNGRPFEPQDIYAITDIGEGTKANDDDKIGRFGVGFKAVFAYSDTPHIWSQDFSFKITELVLPSAIDSRHNLGNKTRFEFPFNNPKKLPNTAYSEVETGLGELAETTLLFLSNLMSISWRIGEINSGEVMRIQHSENHYEVLKQSNGKTKASSHFLKFDKPVEILEKQRVAVAFLLDFLPNVQQFNPNAPLHLQLKIVPAKPGRVAVFFPAEKEVSGLRFHIHAPFVPELSRASIKETPNNQPLFLQIASLTVSALHQIRDLSLLTSEFLGVLPNSQDPIPKRYKDIRSAIINEMNEQPLTPTYLKTHAPAKQLLQGKASLKGLISNNDLKLLLDCNDDTLQWAIGAAQKNSNVDRFLSDLSIQPWDIDQFVDLIEDKTCSFYIDDEDNESFIVWLTRKTVKWHQQFYATLYKELELENQLYRLSNSRIIRLNNGKYDIGSNCYFPSDTSENDDVLPSVDSNVYMSGTNKIQQDNAKKLLEETGVREVGETEQVEAILKKRYSSKNTTPRKIDLKRFIALVEKDPNQAAKFSEYYILELSNKSWGKPSELFLDQPFLDTGLSSYYKAIGGNATRFSLSENYLNFGTTVKKIIKFAEAVGAQTKLVAKKRSLDISHPHFHELKKDWLNAYVKVTYTGIDEDWYIPLLKISLEKNSVCVSQLIWKSMMGCTPHVLAARFRPNKQYDIRTAPSSLVLELQKYPWVPQSNGEFVRSEEAIAGLLPEGFPFDPGWQWLKAIHFGVAVEKKTEEYRRKQAMFIELGFADKNSLDRAKRFTALPQDEQERILAELERKAIVDLPEHESSNPGRRAERVSLQSVDAPERLTEERTRVVSIGIEAVKQDAAQYLLQQYTNLDGKMICQVCKASLPFNLDDGIGYFEKVEFLPSLKKRHYQNYLALCPNHSAMFLYVNGSTDVMHDMFVELSGNELKVVLAQKDATIYFTKTQIADLKSILRTDNEQNT